MRERGIIMGPESVRAILAGSKSQTRRVVKPQPGENRGCAGDVYPYEPYGGELAVNVGEAGGYSIRPLACPYGAPGDRLWVKEGWSACDYDTAFAPRYRADGVAPHATGWRSPMFMPRWASRLTLEITGVRVQRVQEISEDDARAEGCHWSAGAREFGQDREVPFTARDDFAAGWDALNAKRGFPWAANSWVWAVSFNRVVAARAAGEGE